MLNQNMTYCAVIVTPCLLLQVGLDCKEVSPLAWGVLKTGCNDFVAIGDEVRLVILIVVGTSRIFVCLFVCLLAVATGDEVRLALVAGTAGFGVRMRALPYDPPHTTHHLTPTHHPPFRCVGRA